MKINNIDNQEVFFSNFPEKEGFFFQYGEDTAHVCACGNFAKKPMKCNCNDEHISTIFSREISYYGPAKAEDKLQEWLPIPGTFKLEKISDFNYSLSLKSVGFKYTEKENLLELSEDENVITFNTITWDVQMLKSPYLDPDFPYCQNGALITSLFKIISSLHPEEEDNNKAFLTLLSAFRNDVLLLDYDTLVKRSSMLETTMSLEDSIHFVFTHIRDKDKFVTFKEGLEDFFGIDYTEIIASHSEDFNYAAAYVLAGLEDSKRAYYYARDKSYNAVIDTTEDIDLTNLDSIIDEDFYTLLDIYDSCFKTSRDMIYDSYSLFKELSEDERDFIIDFAQGMDDFPPLNKSLENYKKYKSKIIDPTSGESLANQLINVRKFASQTIGVISNTSEVVFKHYAEYLSYKSIHGEDKTIRNYFERNLLEDIDSSITSKEKLEFFFEILDIDAQLAIDVLTYKGRLTKDYKAELYNKIA